MSHSLRGYCAWESVVAGEVDTLYPDLVAGEVDTLYQDLGSRGVLM